MSVSDSLSGEIGTVRKKWKGRTPVALLYPNCYPVAVSNLGFQLVYSLLNQRDDLVCERFVYPESGQPFRSLESSRPLGDFPLVLGSVSFEQDYPRLAAMLAAGGLAPFAAARPPEIGPGFPLVVLGGIAVSMNPEPLAPFADLMVIGEAEPLLDKLMDALGAYGSLRREDLLMRVAASLPGCYAPGFYSFSYKEHGEVERVEARAGLPVRVRRVRAMRMERAAHSALLSPRAELGMYMVELGRGCSRGCRFCAAGFIGRPPRLWTPEAILDGLRERPPGLDRIGLLGMEMAAEDTLERITRSLAAEQCALSFSSLRADRIDAPVLALLARSGLKSVAIAADGCSRRLRRLINKGIEEDDLLLAAERLARTGIPHIKVYVMIGLPGETREDIDELLALLDRLHQRILPPGRARGRVTEITLSVSRSRFWST